MLQTFTKHQMVPQNTDNEVWQRVSMVDSTKKNIVQIVMQRKLKFFGHICRMPDHID